MWFSFILSSLEFSELHKEMFLMKAGKFLASLSSDVFSICFHFLLLFPRLQLHIYYIVSCFTGLWGSVKFCFNLWCLDLIISCLIIYPSPSSLTFFTFIMLSVPSDGVLDFSWVFIYRIFISFYSFYFFYESPYMLTHSDHILFFNSWIKLNTAVSDSLPNPILGLP